MFLPGHCCNTAWYPAFRLLSLLNPSRFMPTALVPLSAGQTSHILPVWPQCTLKRSSCHWIFKRVPSRAEQEVWNGILLNDQSLERKRGHKYLASTSIYLAGSICLIGGWCVPHVGEIKFLQCHMLQWAQTFILWESLQWVSNAEGKFGWSIPSMESVSNIAVCLVKIVSPTITNFICGIVVTYTLQGKCSLF